MHISSKKTRDLENISNPLLDTPDRPPVYSWGGVRMTNQEGKISNAGFTFIGFLFAFVIARIMEPLYKLTYIFYHSGFEGHHYASMFHLFLAFIVITTGWVGWKRTAVRVGELDKVASIAFINLLLDVCIVTFFMFLLATVDSGGTLTSLTFAEKDTPLTSYKPELWTCIGIMALYTGYTLLYRKFKFYQKREWKYLLGLILVATLCNQLKLSGLFWVIAVDIFLIAYMFIYRWHNDSGKQTVVA